MNKKELLNERMAERQKNINKEIKTEYIIKENAKLKNKVEKLEEENEEMRELLIKTILRDYPGRGVL